MKLLLKSNLARPEEIALIIEELKTLKTTRGLTDIEDIYSYVKGKLGSPITKLATHIKGKPVSVVLDSILGELDDIFNGDTPYLEKYLINNKTTMVTSKTGYTGCVYETINAEMLKLFNTIGVEQTVLLYLLIIYHMAA